MMELFYKISFNGFSRSLLFILLFSQKKLHDYIRLYEVHLKETRNSCFYVTPKNHWLMFVVF